MQGTIAANKEDAQKMAAFNLGVAEAVKVLKSFFSSLWLDFTLIEGNAQLQYFVAMDVFLFMKACAFSSSALSLNVQYLIFFLDEKA